MSTHADDIIELSEHPIDLLRVRAHLASADPAHAGGVCMFEGCTRSVRHPDHGDLELLDYSAYTDMALTQLRRLATEARRRWPIGALAIVHRVGAVGVGKPSVIIGVACGHRAEAFAACRWLIDALKRDVPIWKKEQWSSGVSTWPEPAMEPPSRE